MQLNEMQESASWPGMAAGKEKNIRADHFQTPWPRRWYYSNRSILKHPHDSDPAPFLDGWASITSNFSTIQLYRLDDSEMANNMPRARFSIEEKIKSTQHRDRLQYQVSQ